MEVITTATVDNAGQLRIDQPHLWSAGLEEFAGRRITLIATDKRKRSSKANKRYWGAIVPTVRDFLSIGRPVPLSKEQVHAVLKTAFLGTESTLYGDVPKSSSDLTPSEFSDFMDEVQSHFSAEHGLTFPEVVGV